MRQAWLLAAAATAVTWSAPALAVTSTRVIITEDQQEVSETRISLFDADTGTRVQPQDDDDDSTLFLLDGGRYRVAVDGKDVEEITVSGTGSRTFRIAVPSGAGGPGDGFPPQIGLLGQFTRFNIPATGIGFMRDGPYGSAPEEFAIDGPDSVDHYGGTAFFQFPGGGIAPLISVHYSEGSSGPFAISIPAGGGVDSGLVYGDLSPSGASGIATPLGLEAASAVDSKLFGIAADIPFFRSDASSPTQSKFGAALFFHDWKRTYASAAGYSDATYDFSQERLQEIDENHYGLGVFGQVSAPFGPSLTGHLTGRAGGYYWQSDLDSLESNDCNFCPAPDQSWSLAIEQSENDVAFFSELGAALELLVTPNVGIWVGGSGQYLSKVGSIFNPYSGDQVFFDGLSTGLRTDEMWSWSLMAGLTIDLP